MLKRVKKGASYSWRLLRETVLIYGRISGGESAAAFAYYALFSLVPLVALMLTLGSYIFPADSVFETIHRFVPMGDDQQELLWSMVHGYATLLIEQQIRRNEDGTPIFDMAELMPGFGYRL